ncbi:MAG: hypothetical protein E7464_04130 [Ruminococcaceae bacterium]|nr:hypothetical protein [Oscillospiraceae bacterium]
MGKEDTINVLNLYFDEWKYRHENFWKRLTQFSTITFFTSTLPITFRLFDNLKLPNISLLFFPICGFVLAVVCLIFCLAENSRLVAVDKTIKRIVKDKLGHCYEKEQRTLFEKKQWNHRIFKLPFFEWRIGTWVPLVITLLQIGLSILMVYLIMTNRI